MAEVAVDVWTWPLDAATEIVADLACSLTPDERARADRFLSPAHRDSFIVGRGRLRAVLGDYIGQPAGDLRFGYNTQGKPHLENRSAPHFNLSHSGTLAALAICDSYPIGIDIEVVRPTVEQIAERFFSPAEVAALAALPEDERTAAFFRCWTRKEAVVKALGGGLNIPLDSFTVSVRDEANPQMLHVDGATDRDIACWKFVSFSPASAMAGAVAVKVAHPDLRLALNFRSLK